MRFYEILFLIILVSMSTKSITFLVIDFGGLFNIFERFRLSLLPKNELLELKKLRLKNDNDEINFNYPIEVQEIYDNYELYLNYFKHSTNFLQTFKGTLFELFTCKYCLSVYVSLILCVISSIQYEITALGFVFIWLSSVFLHSIYSKHI